MNAYEEFLLFDVPRFSSKSTSSYFKAGSMSSSTPSVLLNKIWIDHDRALLLGPRILVREWWATFWVSALSVWAAIWAAKYWESIVDKEHGIIKDRGGRQTSEISMSTSRILAHTRRAQAGQARHREDPQDVVKDSSSPDRAVWDLLRNIKGILKESILMLGDRTTQSTRRQKVRNFWQNILNNREELRELSLWLMFSAAAFAGTSIGPTFVSYLQSDGIALSASPTCGSWVANGSTRDMIYAWNQAEEQAASYYRSCYETNPSTKECNIYANNALLSQETDHDDCPFRGDVCLLGPKSAVTFDTGYLDANTLGINSRTRPFYRRRTTCAPLVTKGYVEVQDNYLGFLIQAQFYYGTRDRGWTYSQSRIFSLPGTSSPTYEVAVKVSGRDFTPLPEFTNPDGGHVVLLFVTSFNIQHPVRSDDPIFPFKTHISSNSTGNPDLDQMLNYWTNEERHGAVLGCVEFAEICKDASNSSCFDPWVDNRPVSTLDDENYALGLGLLQSGNWKSINTRTSKELDATRKIVDIWISMPLAQEQWKLEARRLFESSMIRARLEVLELARGARAAIPHFRDQMQDIHRGICRKIKFQSNGFKNLSVTGLLFAFLTPPALAFRVKEKPLFFWPVHYIWKLAKFQVKNEPLIKWPWIGVRALGKLLSEATSEIRKFWSEKLGPALWRPLSKLCSSLKRQPVRE